MKLFGHPVHPLMIHFPTALLPMDLALSIMDYHYGDHSFSLAGFYCLVGGSVIGLLAMISGLIDLLAIPRSNKQALVAALYHAFINGTIILAYCVITFRSWQRFPQLEADATTIAVRAFLIASLFAGNYWGGKLIYSHHIGIDLKNKNENNL